jgi:two-component system, cell cycle sensor histidine kinase and response regulator CckA
MPTDKAGWSPTRPIVFGALAGCFAVLALGFLALSDRPAPDRALTAAMLVVGGVALAAVIAWPGPRRTILVAVLIDGGTLVSSAREPSGLALAVFVPMLTALLLVLHLRGVRLALALAACWAAGIAGTILSFELGSMAPFDGPSAEWLSVLFAMIVTGVAYLALWWVSERLRAAGEEAAEARLAAESGELRYRVLFENSSEAIVITDPEVRLLDANPAALALAGLSLDQLRATSLDTLVDAGTLARIWSDGDRVLAGEPVVAEYTIRRADGRRLFLEVNMGRLPDGNVVVSLRDLTARREAEATRTRLAAAIEQAGDLIVIVDDDFTIEYVNRAFEEATGWTALEAVGQSARTLMRSGLHAPEFYQGLEDAIKRGEQWAGRILDRRKDGSTLEEYLRISPLRDADGRVVGAVEVSRDMTREIELENQLLQSARMDAIGQLAGGVAHDFNNLLTAIRGYTDLVRMGLPEAMESERADLGVAIEAADQAADLTGQLLAFASRTLREPRIVDPEMAVAEFAPMLRRLVGEHIALETSLSGGVGRIMVDPTQFEQLLLNLALNARDAMPDGGRLAVSLARETLVGSSTEHPQARPGQYVVLTVADTGHGMDDATSRRVFEPFFTTKEKGRGTGLGLATVFGIMRMSSGWVEVSSVPSMGSKFRLYFPRLAEMAGDEPPADGPGEGRGTETVLLVEDDASVRSLATRALSSLGYLVIAAGGGDEALATADAMDDLFDILVTDVVMPGMQGPELARRLEARKPGIPVLFCSGFTDSPEITGRPGCSYLAKPYSSETLGRAVRVALNGASPTVAPKGVRGGQDRTM